MQNNQRVVYQRRAYIKINHRWTFLDSERWNEKNRSFLPFIFPITSFLLKQGSNEDLIFHEIWSRLFAGVLPYQLTKTEDIPTLLSLIFISNIFQPHSIPIPSYIWLNISSLEVRFRNYRWQKHQKIIKDHEIEIASCFRTNLMLFKWDTAVMAYYNRLFFFRSF